SPSRSSTRRAEVVSPSPHVLSRGNVALSQTTTDRPAATPRMAAAAPAGPPPTTSRSQSTPTAVDGTASSLNGPPSSTTVARRRGRPAPGGRRPGPGGRTDTWRTSHAFDQQSGGSAQERSLRTPCDSSGGEPAPP